MKPMHLGKLLILAALIFTLQGCGGGGGNGGSGSSTTFTFKVKNNSSYTVTAFYLSPSSSGSWGANQLTNPIAPGGSRTISGVSPCSFNFDFYATNGSVTWGPSYNNAMPPCGGTFKLTLN